MKINFLSNFNNTKFNNDLNSTVKGSNYSLNPNMSYPNLRPLQRDTVSFGSKEKIIESAFVDGYTAQLPLFKTMGQKLMKILEDVCNEVEGAVYDREYCESALNKSLERYIEKLKDSGSVPMDRIRSTVFIKDLYDFSIISNFIKALEKRDYYILPIPDKHSGRKVLSWKHDFDVRLNDEDKKLISPDEIKKLPVYLRECISKKQKSGYGDIQMRIVDASSLPKSQRTPKNLNKLVPQEVIFIFGRATADAKHAESKYVYNITRVLEKLHVLNSGYSGNIVHDIGLNIGGIGSILRSFISKPLYRNAENVDTKIKGAYDLEDVVLNEKQCVILRNTIAELTDNTKKFYSKRIKIIKSPDYDIEIEKMIKATPEYKSRSNKRVTDSEISIKRNELLKELRGNQKEDLAVIAKQRIELDNTIDKYGVKIDEIVKLEDQLLKIEVQLETLEKKTKTILANTTLLPEEKIEKLQDIQIKKDAAQLKKQNVIEKMAELDNTGKNVKSEQ